MSFAVARSSPASPTSDTANAPGARARTSTAITAEAAVRMKPGVTGSFPAARRELPFASDRQPRLVLLLVAVHAHDHALAALDLLLEPEARLGDLALRVALLDRLDHAAELVDLAELGIGRLLEAIGERLDEVGAAERVDRVRDAGLVGDDLLRPQRDAHRLLCGERERLVVGVRVERLRAAEHRRQRLGRGAHDVVERLLRRQRHPRRLRVEAHQERALVTRAVGLLQLPRPDAAGRAVFGDLLEEVDVRVEEEAEPGRELV